VASTPGNLDGPAGVDQVRVREVPAVGLNDVPTGPHQLLVQRPVAQLLLGDAGERVAGTHRPLPAITCPGQVVLLPSVLLARLAGHEKAPPGAEDVRTVETAAVRLRASVVGLRDLTPSAAVSEVLRRDVPERVAGADDVLPRRRHARLGGRSPPEGGLQRRRLGGDRLGAFAFDVRHAHDCRGG
jgi:hypothetical protein